MIPNMCSKPKTASDLVTNPVIALAADLVQRPSITPEDAGCQELIAAKLTDAGFNCESMIFGDVTNLWAKFGNCSPLLCFAGHTDVVPPGNKLLWDMDPFSAVIHDGKLFGRGAADMKGSLAAMVCAADRFVNTHPDFAGSIAFLITSDEEGPAVDGTRKVLETLIAREESIDWCIVGEPSSGKDMGDCVRIGRRGSLTGVLRVPGIQGHVAYPHLADNPVRRFAPALADMHAIEWDSGNDAFPPTGFEVVRLESGIGTDNVTPDELLVRFNFRYSTEWTAASLAMKVEKVLKQYEFEYEIEWILSGEPFLTREGRLTESLTNSIKEVIGISPMFSTGGGTSDGRFIAPTGADVVEFGPRNHTIHKVNENVSLRDLVLLSAVYQRTAEMLLL